MCDERERLIGYVYDECDPRERAEIDRHLETCAECRDEIRGLRAVRQDLLAWDVPAHESVWKPFAPARVAPSWRLVPAWAMAAAAAIMFLFGAAGGVVTNAFMERQAPAVAPAVSAQVVPAGVSRAELDALRAQIVDGMRSEMDARVRLISAHSQGGDGNQATLQQVRALQLTHDRRYDQLINLIMKLNNDMITVQKSEDGKIESLRQQMSSVLSQQNPGR